MPTRGDILKREIRIRSSEGPDFDCYVATPQTEQKVPAIVLASAIHGVDQDLRGIADAFASRGYMMQGNTKAFDRNTYDFSMQRALALLEGLR